MKNPAHQTIRALCLVILGICIGLVAGQIRIEEMRQAEENTEAFQLRSIADLKREIHDQEMYYMKEMALYRHAAGFRLRVPSPAEVSAGLTCADEDFSRSGTPATSIRSWKPRADGRCYVEDAIQGGIQ